MVGESEATLGYQRDAKDVLENEILPFLKKHGKEIGHKAALGNKLCIEIMQRYRMVFDFAEHISIGLLHDSIKQYQKEELGGN